MYIQLLPSPNTNVFHPAVDKINGTLKMHKGISIKYIIACYLSPPHVGEIIHFIKKVNVSQSNDNCLQI